MTAFRSRRKFVRRGRKTSWHEPERLQGQASRDAEHPNRKYFVYVLKTDSGHYVGHTYSVKNRVAQHRRGDVESTRGTNPKLAWNSRAYATRSEAADFEARSLADLSSFSGPCSGCWP